MTANVEFDYDDIRSIRDEEVSATIAELLEDDAFMQAVKPLIAPMTAQQFAAHLRQMDTVDRFQLEVIYPTVQKLIKKTTTSLYGVNWERANDGKAHVFISNHRDIVLDAGFLNMLMFDYKMNTSEIAIGDNLLIYSWITKLVRLNKSFIVKRSVSVRQMLQTSKQLSAYIHDTINNRNQSVWIAQREGRAKDSNDKTQPSLMKMLALAENGHPIEAWKNLNILPLSISYEFDPCDFLKAKEFQMKRDNPEHKKTKADDIENMVTGIMGFKGRVCFKLGRPVNEQLDTLKTDIARPEALNEIVQIIDSEIYRNYTFFPFNYVAYDIMTDSERFVSEYTADDKKRFLEYVEKQIDRIDLENKDHRFLQTKIVEMYGNTVKNYLSVQ